MNNDAHRILVSAIASHGEKLAISDAYCKVYLAGYMADYPDEKQLLTSLRQLELPNILLACRRLEISDSDVCQFIKTLELKHSYSPYDFAWGVDAWVAALTMPDLIRRNIREQCFPQASQQLNSDGKSVTDIADEDTEYIENIIPENKTHVNKRNVLLPSATMMLLGLTTALLAVGSMPMANNHSTAMVQEKPPQSKLVTLKHSDKQDNTLNVMQKERLPTVRRADTEFAQLTMVSEPRKSAIKNQPLRRDIPTKNQRARRLNAHIEAFLTQEN